MSYAQYRCQRHATCHKFIVRYHLSHSVRRHKKHKGECVGALLNIAFLTLSHTVVWHGIRVDKKMIEFMSYGEMLPAFRMV